MAHPRPHATAILPVKDDGADLRAAVESVLDQDYDGELDVVIAVAPSGDDTHQVAAALAAAHENVQVTPNPRGGTAAGLNAALAAAAGTVIVRVDARCELPTDYVRTAVDTMASTGSANVGGVQAAYGTTPYQRAVARAMTSRFGVGDAKFHYGGDPGPVDTVYLGVFDAEVLRSVGGFDETLVRNQDYELNWRLREAGHTIWFEPAMVVRYQPRASARALASQYFQYGQWKREVLRRHPGSLRARQLAAPLTLIGLAVGVAGLATGRRWMGLAPAVYGTAVAAASAGAGQDAAERSRLLGVFPTMHMSWAAGFLLGPPTQDETR